VIEKIYSGPHDYAVPKEILPLMAQHALAKLGFIVVQIDGMGTNWRSKAFHDVCWKNLRDGGLPDRIAWMKHAQVTRPWMDLDHVGIYGVSAGGQSAMGALLWHADFYKAAVADCGVHDNRMDKLWLNEQWMGWPVDESYERSSNVVHAQNLQGALLLIVGELDDNVDPASTMQVVRALNEAEKDYELLVFPGHGHGETPNGLGERRLKDFVVRHLMGVMPPNRNLCSGRAD
jgi:dipeptidyl-peptidase-4